MDASTSCPTSTGVTRPSSAVSRPASPSESDRSWARPRPGRRVPRKRTRRRPNDTAERGPMRTGVARLLALVATLGLAAGASAQAIAPADFLPLGPGAQWSYQKASGSGPAEVRLNVVDVNETSSGTRYLVEVPFETVSGRVRFEIGTDGRLLLRALEAEVN